MKILNRIDLTLCVLHSTEPYTWQSWISKEHSEEKIFPGLNLDAWDITDFHEQLQFEINPWLETHIDTSLYVLRKLRHPTKVGARTTFRVWDYSLGYYRDFTMEVPGRLLSNGEPRLFEHVDKFTVNIASTTVEQDGKLQERIKELYILPNGGNPIWVPESAFGTGTEFGIERNCKRIVSYSPVGNDMGAYGALHVYVPDLNKEAVYRWICDTVEAQEKALREKRKNIVSK
jgi:hypothetical protein